jgi:hypothetical protein
MIVLKMLDVRDRAAVARCSSALNVVVGVSSNRHPGVLDAR